MSDVDFVDISKITDDVEEDSRKIFLPPQMKCACHTLNLIGSADAEKAIKSSSNYSRMHHTSFGKCQGLWNAIHRSSKASDVVCELCPNKQFLVPCPTRWNSKFEAVSRLLELKDKLDSVCENLNLPSFSDGELDFLTEYEIVMKPLATTLTVLEGDQNCFFGMLLPLLIKLKKQLVTARNGSLKYCLPLAEALLKGLENRYADFFQLSEKVHEFIVAAAVHPQYKLKWVPPASRDRVKSEVTEEAIKMAFEIEMPKDKSDNTEDAKIEDEYGYEEELTVEPKGKNAIIQEEVNRFYSNSENEIDSLHNYPILKKVFIRYNTTLPSSAAVERMFSVAGLILTPHRNQLSDNMFEKLLLLKQNSALKC